MQIESEGKPRNWYQSPNEAVTAEAYLVTQKSVYLVEAYNYGRYQMRQGRSQQIGKVTDKPEELLESA